MFCAEIGFVGPCDAQCTHVGAVNVNESQLEASVSPPLPGRCQFGRTCMEPDPRNNTEHSEFRHQITGNTHKSEKNPERTRRQFVKPLVAAMKDINH